ncbi:hypothetical protein T4E_3407 [Trichinella pseudospiralis]|uniref:Uncharacterized protein n=1 Tax=Trichinella pseudospiralis TaxID=6337 RepID=A0A0V0XJM1_TRIPS|nr:hypothetical protein T4E_3407 [Trichinella pseudospiralis]
MFDVINAAHQKIGQAFIKQLGKSDIWRGATKSYVLPKSLVDAVKTKEEIEEFLTSQKANDEESLNRGGKNYEKMKAIL